MKSALEALGTPGGVILYPTETLYGIGGRAGDVRAAKRIGRIKGRGLQPLIVLIDSIPFGLPPLAAALARAFWPGPVTLIVPANGAYPMEIQGPEGTIALRWSSHPVVQKLVASVGPITSTSANRSGGEPLLALTDHGLAVDEVVDVGIIAPSAPSTLVHYSGRILRHGEMAELVAGFIEAWLAEGHSIA
jgi:L-threonylcarbamoyladenylate synthase